MRPLMQSRVLGTCPSLLLVLQTRADEFVACRALECRERADEIVGRREDRSIIHRAVINKSGNDYFKAEFYFLDFGYSSCAD